MILKIILSLLGCISGLIIHFYPWLSGQQFDIFELKDISIGVSSWYGDVITELGIPIEIGEFRRGSWEGKTFFYDGLIFYIVGSTERSRRVEFFQIFCENYRLGGREELGLGSTKREVQQAASRRRLISIIISYEPELIMEVYHMHSSRSLVFTFDQNNVVTQIEVF